MEPDGAVHEVWVGEGDAAGVIGEEGGFADGSEFGEGDAAVGGVVDDVAGEPWGVGGWGGGGEGEGEGDDGEQGEGLGCAGMKKPERANPLRRKDRRGGSD